MAEEKNIPDRIFKIAEGYEGIPLDFHEDDDDLTIIFVDGRKMVFEKESATKKRQQEAEAKLSEQYAVDALIAHEAAIKAEQSARDALDAATKRAETLRAIADGQKPEPEAKTEEKAQARQSKGKGKK